MGLLDKIESVIPGHKTDAEKEHAARTDSAVGEHGTHEHHLFSHSHHSAPHTVSEHTTTKPVTTTAEHSGTTPATTTTTHDSKSSTTPVVPSSTEHATVAPPTTTAPVGTAPTQPTPGSSSTTTTTKTAGTKVDGPSDAHDTPQSHYNLPSNAGSVFTGNPGRYHDVHDTPITEHGFNKREHGTSSVLPHREQHTTAAPHDTHKSEHSGVTGMIHNLTRSHGKDHLHEATHTAPGHVVEHTTTTSTGPHVGDHTASTTAPVKTAGQALTDTARHDQAKEGVNFIPNAENPKAIPTAGGRNIGAGQIDHNATGTIGKESLGEKAAPASASAAPATTAPVKDAKLPEHPAEPAPTPAAHT